MNVEIEEVYQCLADAKVNVELIPSRGNNNEFLWTCRLREYGNSNNKTQMLLAGGHTADEALYHATEAWIGAMYIPLDWRARATDVGPVDETTMVSPPTFDTAEARKRLAARFGTHPSGNTSARKNGR
jgi:hypothetical protein